MHCTELLVYMLHCLDMVIDYWRWYRGL